MIADRITADSPVILCRPVVVQYYEKMTSQLAVERLCLWTVGVTYCSISINLPRILCFRCDSSI